MYLRTRDYDGYILKDNLNQIIAADPGIRTIGERLAQATAISMLSQKFDTRREFTDTNPYSPLVAYTAGQRAEMNFTPYDAVGTSYTADASLAINYITINGLVYVNKTAIASPAGAFAPAKWTLLGTLYDLYYLQIPYRIFDYQRHYCVGDSVYWRGKVYTCILESFSVNQEARLHAVEVSNIPNMNYFPDEQKNGALQWGTGTPYVIPANTLDPYTYVNTTFTAYNPATAYVVGNTFLYTEPDGDLIVYYVLQNFTGNTNGTPGTVSAYCNPFTWVLGDNRDQIVLDALIAITLKRIHSRIAPRNIPELRMNEYNEAMRTLKKLADGDIVPDAITTLQPVQGDAVTWGGITKNNNQYN